MNNDSKSEEKHIHTDTQSVHECEMCKAPAEKKKKIDGKMNIKTVVKGIMSNKKKKDIAVEAGSLANTDPARINSVNNVMKTNAFKELLKEYETQIDVEKECIDYINRVYVEVDEEMEDEQYYAKQKKLKYAREYYHSPKGQAIAKNSAHKRRVAMQDTDITTEWLIELRENTTHCPYCNELLENKDVHLDHIIPLSKYGTHTKDNVTYCCAFCNHSKGNKLIEINILLND